MELKIALENIVNDMIGIGIDKAYVTNNFLTPVSYIDQAVSYQQRGLPLAKEIAAGLFLKGFQQICLVDRKHVGFNFLIKQLSWYEYKRVNEKDMGETYPYKNIGSKIIREYDTLKSPAEKALLEYYFRNAIEEIREKLKAKKSK